MEGNSGAFFHAASTHLKRLDALQTSCLEKLGLSESEAFLKYNLAPLQLRRNIAMLGLLYKIARRETHPAFFDLFPFDNAVPHHTTRLTMRRHRIQLQNRCDGSQSDVLNRSIFGMVRVFNVLPEEAINQTSVKMFQKVLTRIAKEHCEAGRNFEEMYSTRKP